MTAPAGNRRTRPFAAFASIAFGLTSMLVAAAPVAAATPTATIRLVSQDLRVAPDGLATFTVHVDGDAIGSTATSIAVANYLPIETRGGVRLAIDADPAGRPVSQFELDPTVQPLDADGNYVLQVGTRSSTAAVEPLGATLKMSTAGLYPITIDVRVDDRPISSLVTFLELTDESELNAPVRTAIAARIDAAPTLGPTGATTVPSTSRATIDRLTGLLTAHPDVPLTIALRPELLEGLTRSGDAQDADRLDALTAAFGTGTINELLPQTYVSLDPAASIDGGLGIEFGDQLLHGEDVIGSTIGASPGRTLWWLDSPIDADGLALLRYLGVKRLLVDSELRAGLPARDGALGAPAESTDTPMPSLLSDLVVQDRLLSPADDPVLRAYQIVADLMAMSMDAERTVDAESEDSPEPLGMMIDLGDLSAVDATLLDTLLGLLAVNPRIALGAGSDVIDELDRATADRDLDRFPIAEPQSDPSIAERASELRKLSEAIGSTSTMLAANDPRPARWTALVDVYPANNLDETTRDRYSSQLDGEIGELRNCVTVLTTGRISLGGRRSKVPITLLNQCEGALQVRIALSSPKLELAEPTQLVSITGRQTIEIPVEAKTNGVFIVTVQLVTPGADSPATLGRPTTFTVRSTALTGLGQVISGALLVVLATWWVQHVRGRRRRRRAGAVAAHLGGHPSAGNEPSAEPAVPPPVASPTHATRAASLPPS